MITTRLGFLKTALLAPFALKGVTALRASPASPTPQPRGGVVYRTGWPWRERTVGPLITREYVDGRGDRDSGLGSGWLLVHCHRADGTIDYYALTGATPFRHGPRLATITPRSAYLALADHPAELIDWVATVSERADGRPLLTVQYREVTFS